MQSPTATRPRSSRCELVCWHSERQRRLLRWGYPAAFLAFGIVISGVTLPSIVVLAATVPAAALLVAGWRPGLRIEADPSLPGVHSTAATRHHLRHDRRPRHHRIVAVISSKYSLRN